MGTNFRIIDLGVILAGIGCMTVVLTAGFNSSNTAYRIKCQDNLKKIGVALSGYASKNNDVLPVVNDRDNWKKIWCLENSFVTYLRLKPHAGTRAKGNVLECPGESRYETFTHIGYVMNVNLHTLTPKIPNTGGVENCLTFPLRRQRLPQRMAPCTYWIPGRQIMIKIM